MSKKAIELKELIEKARDIAIESGIGTLNLNQALALLQKQPPAGEFTKDLRNRINNPNAYFDPWATKRDALSLEACVIIDRQAEDNKNQAAEIKWLKKALKIYGDHLGACYANLGIGKCNCGLEQALTSGTKKKSEVEK